MSGEENESSQDGLENEYSEDGGEGLANGSLDDVGDVVKVDDNPMEDGAHGFGATGDGGSYLGPMKRRNFTPG